MATLIRLDQYDFDILPSLVDIVATTINYMNGCSNFISDYCIYPDKTGVVYENIQHKLSKIIVGDGKILKIPYRIYGSNFSMPTLFLRSVMVDGILPSHLCQLSRCIDKIYLDSPNQGLNGGIFVDAPIDAPTIKLINRALMHWDGYIYYDEYNYA